MSRLFVIGNGFDTAHGLQTKYSDFRSFVCKKNRKIFNIIEQAEIEYNKTKKTACDLSENWSYFEEILGYTDFQQINKEETVAIKEALPQEKTQGENEKENFIKVFDEKSSKIFENNTYVLKETDKLFSEWIEGIEIPKSHQKCLKFNPTDKFLNFNYTITLEKLYGIEEVKHIHINQCTNKKYKYIFGFKEPDPEVNPDQKKNSLRNNFTRFTGLEKETGTVKNEFIKPVYSIIDEGKVDYGKNEIKEIYFWGFELAEVDKPYIEKIINDHVGTIKRVKLCKFQYSIEKKREKYRQFIKNCSLDIELECFKDYS